MDTPTTVLLAGLVLGYLVLLGILTRRGAERFTVGSRRWIFLALAAALFATLVHALPEDVPEDAPYAALFRGALTPPALATLLTNLMVVFFLMQALRYLQYRRASLWCALALIWWGAGAAGAALTPDLALGSDRWLGTIYDPIEWPSLLVVAGWMVIGGGLAMAAFYAFYRAPLPEVANRALFWASVIPVVMLGVVVGSSGTRGLAELGWIMQALGLAAATYSVWTYRVLDIRRTLRLVIVSGLLAVVTALAFFTALIAAQELDAPTRAERTVLLGALALAGAMAFLPLYGLARRLAVRIFGGAEEQAALVLRRFSEEITGVVELDTLIEVTLRTLSRVLGVRRGGLLLVSYEPSDVLRLEPAPSLRGELPDIRGRVASASPIVGQLVGRRAPLLQYDLDFGRAFAAATDAERRFFQQMRMSAYAPVTVQGRMIGILCAGPKASDAPFTPPDLEMLMALANQVGVALRNARLVADLRRREGDQAELNRQLSSTKEQLERLDSVKTDFITIASHELRTPLTQIRGYAEIMEQMNEEGLLEQDQIASMTGNLRQAADRLENLIEAMLDVSQLDVDAMDLDMGAVSVAQAMRAAIEPLTESVIARKLMVSSRGLGPLPPIQGDMLRLVQAFRNILLNAIKYTPDGGRIDIRGRLQDDEIVITIRDTGIGIDPQNHELIFQKFFRAHDPSFHSTGMTKFMGAGPGLGLTIARGVIEAHGGRIWVESAGEDRAGLPGSVFSVALPLRPPAEARRVLTFEHLFRQEPPHGADGAGDADATAVRRTAGR